MEECREVVTTYVPKDFCSQTLLLYLKGDPWWVCDKLQMNMDNQVIIIIIIIKFYYYYYYHYHH